MQRRLPVIPTLIVLIAVAVMVRLGLWQLDRLHQKEALLARYQAAQQQSAILPLGVLPVGDADLFRRAAIHCQRVISLDKRAGANAAGESGIAHIATCETAGPTAAPTVGDARRSGEIVLGWSRDLREVTWTGGDAIGTLAPGKDGAVRLVADPPLAGLEANARPDPSAIANNHLSYALQWFAFAGAALVIYALALRKRLAAGGEGG